MQNNHDKTTAKFKDSLHAAGLRVTPIRLEILLRLYNAEKPLSISHLAKDINQAHFVSIYRSMDAMHKKGIIKHVPMGFKSTFELSDNLKPHHHHATCELCQRTFDIQDYKLEMIIKDIGLRSGLTPTSHQLEIYGICNRCST